MKIAIDLTSLADNFSGFERFALNITKELLEKEKRNTYILIFKYEIYPYFTKYKNDVNIAVVVLPRRQKLWFYQVTLYRALRKIRSDVFIFPAFPSPLLFRAKGIVNTIHDLGCWDCSGTMTFKMVQYFRLMYRNAARNSQFIITVSEFSKMRIRKILGVESDRICVVYNGIEDNMYRTPKNNWQYVRKKYGLPECFILCLSTLEPRKNLQLLLNVYIDILKNGRCPYKLVLAGRKGWKMDAVLNKIPEKYKQDIVFTGYIDEEDLPQIYRHAYVFVFPSLYEGFGIPPLEAMATGCQVISSDAEALREVLSDCAIYFENNNIDSLRNVLLNYIEGNYKKIPQNKLIEYSKKFSYSVSVNNLCDYLKAVQ